MKPSKVPVLYCMLNKIVLCWADEQNMMAYQMGTSIYYNTIRDIEAGEELKVWYAAPYAKKIGKSVTPDGVSRGIS